MYWRSGLRLEDRKNWAATWQNQQNGCAPSEDSDQPGHPPSLIRVFTGLMKNAWDLSYMYPLSAQRSFWSDWADAQADLSLRWAHTHFVGCPMQQGSCTLFSRQFQWGQQTYRDCCRIRTGRAFIYVIGMSYPLLFMHVPSHTLSFHKYKSVFDFLFAFFFYFFFLFHRIVNYFKRNCIWLIKFVI